MVSSKVTTTKIHPVGGKLPIMIELNQTVVTNICIVSNSNGINSLVCNYLLDWPISIILY